MYRPLIQLGLWLLSMLVFGSFAVGLGLVIGNAWTMWRLHP